MRTEPGTYWVAIAYGALDVSNSTQFRDVDVLVAPTLPALPLALTGQGADLWRRLVDGPVSDDALTADERVMVREMAEVGLASTSPEHPSRMRSIAEPWLSSPMHEMAYAVVHNVAREHGIRTVFIKGPVLHRMGLRPREHSGDVDLWTTQRDATRLAEVLMEWGWKRSPLSFTFAMYHSLMLEPEEWWCELDVHFRFPGIGITDEDAFGVVTANTTCFEFAGVEVSMPSRTLAAVIHALHLLRPGPWRALTRTQTDEATQAMRVGGQESVAIATSLGALPVLGDVIRQALPEVSLPSELGQLPPEWQRRQASSDTLTYHLATIRSLPLRERPKAIWQAAWASERTVRMSNAHFGVAPKSLFIGRIRRLAHGVVLAVKALGRALRKRI